MKGLHTNVFIRYLVQDDPRQWKLASAFIEKNCSDKTPCFLCHIVLCEIVWVLESNYRQRKDAVVSIIKDLLQTVQIEVQDSDIVWQALKEFTASKADFPDHLIARVNSLAGCDTTATFDKKAGRQTIFELVR